MPFYASSIELVAKPPDCTRKIYCPWLLSVAYQEYYTATGYTGQCFNPFIPSALYKVPSGPMILLKIALYLSQNSPNIWKRVVELVLVCISPRDYFSKLLWSQIYHLNSQDVFWVLPTYMGWRDKWVHTPCAHT